MVSELPDASTLKQLQSLPLEAKVILTKQRIKEWYDHFNGDVYVSFSGGKDSTVLAHIIREMYGDSIPLVFSNTGLEYPEIQAFARKMGAEFVYPKLSFSEVISKHGYPVISKEVAEACQYARKLRDPSRYHEQKRAELNGEREYGDFEDGSRTAWRRRNLEGHSSKDPENISMFNKQKWLPLCRDTDFLISSYCCTVMKKSPLTRYQHKAKRIPYIATLASESRARRQAWLKHGCNSFENRKQTSQPMSFWTEQDVLQYIIQNGLEIASVYGDVVATDKDGYEYQAIPGCCGKLKCSGCQRTGCIFCAFGFNNEKGETRFQRLAKTHPKQYEYCLGGGQYVDNPNYDGTAPEYDGTWKNWNPKKIWVPSKHGLGMKKVFDDCNAIYGKDFMRYE